MRLDAEKRRTYGAGRRPIATYSVAGRFGIEILDEIEIPWCGDFRPCVVWRWSDERDNPRMSCVRDLANDDSGFRAGRAWIPLSKCVRA
jgi:hypothetical protein